MAAPRIYSAYDPPPKVKAEPGGKSLTRQSEADACDINKLMARYEKTGVIPQSIREGVFVDVAEMGDYRTAVEQVRLADELFNGLPAKVRAEFDNDPAAFLDFASDPANRDRMVELGLVEAAPAAVEPAAAPPVPAA